MGEAKERRRAAGRLPGAVTARRSVRDLAGAVALIAAAAALAEVALDVAGAVAARAGHPPDGAGAVAPRTADEPAVALVALAVAVARRAGGVHGILRGGRSPSSVDASAAPGR